MSVDAPLVSIVLVNFKTPAMTLDCVASLERFCRGVSYEVIVVDNASGDDSVERLRAASAPLTVEALPVNLGFGGGCNAGARLAMGKYVYLLNTDTLMEEDSVRVLAEFLEATPAAVAVGSRLRHADGMTQKAAFRFPSALRVFFGAEGVGDALERRIPALRGALSMFIPEEELRQPRRVDWCSGASLMIRTEAYRAIGGFDEDFFLYAEEIDLCRRLLPYGETWFEPRTTVVHLEGASHEDGVISDRRMGFMAAGRRLYYKKHHSAVGALVLILADCGGALVKGLALRLAAVVRRDPKTVYRAKLQLAYARNYFACSYPLPRQ